MNIFRVINARTINICLRFDKLFLSNYCGKSHNDCFRNELHTINRRQISINPCLWEDKIIKTPPFAESVSEGDVRWSKKVGDKIAADDVVGEIETDKTSIPIHSPFSGTILEFLAADGDKVIANQDLVKVTLGGGGEVKPATSSKPSVSEEKKVKTHDETPSSALQNDKFIREVKPLVTPVKTSQQTQKPSRDSTTQVNITGSRGEQRIKMNRMRLRIAQRLKDAQNTCAMLTTFNECDMTEIIKMRKQYQDAFTAKHGVKLGFMSAFLKGAALALQDQPVINAVIDGDDIVYRDYVDISVAVATPKGLVVPVLRNVENMGFAEIEKGIFELGERARLGQLAIEDMDGGTFTISNGGVFGSLLGTPIINPPQSAILGVHATQQRPVAIDGRVEIRPMMYLALTYDHRLVDGREGVLFLKKIKAFIEDPRIVLLGI